MPSKDQKTPQRGTAKSKVIDFPTHREIHFAEDETLMLQREEPTVFIVQGGVIRHVRQITEGKLVDHIVVGMYEQGEFLALDEHSANDFYAGVLPGKLLELDAERYRRYAEDALVLRSALTGSRRHITRLRGDLVGLHRYLMREEERSRRSSTGTNIVGRITASREPLQMPSDAALRDLIEAHAKIEELELALKESRTEDRLHLLSCIDAEKAKYTAAFKEKTDLEHHLKSSENVNAQLREKIAVLDANAKKFNSLLDEWQAKGETQSRQFLDTVNAVLRAKGATPLTERELMLTLHKIDQEQKMPPPELEVDLTGLEPTVMRPPTVPPPSLPKRLAIPKIVLRKHDAEEFQQDDEDAASSQRFDEADALPLSRPTTQLYSDTRRK